jgi:uncharacterized protein (PEP-CTERM system associated)
MATDTATDAKRAVLLAALLLPTVVRAQVATQPEATTSNPAPATVFTPSVGIGERYSSNAFPQEIGNRTSAWITDAGVRFGLVHRGASADLSADLNWRKLFYSSRSDRNGTQRTMNASTRMALIDDLFDLNARGSIALQSRSAFGASLPATTGVANSDDRVETRTFSIRPDLHTRLGSGIVLRATTDAATSRADDAAGLRQRSIDSTASLGSDPSSAGLVVWSLSGQSQQFEGTGIANADRSIRRAQATLRINPAAAFGFSVFGGRETTDLANTADRQESASIWGGGIRWIPHERLAFGATAGKRFFGTEYAAALAYRRPLSSWRFTATRDITFLGSRTEAGAVSPFIGMLTDLLRGTTPDPANREVAARGRLADAGVPLALNAPPDALNARPFLNQRLDASFLYTGQRDTMTFSAGYRKQVAFDNPSSVVQPGTFENTRQRNAGAIWAHRLDRAVTLNYNFQFFQTEGLQNTGRQTLQRQHSLTAAKRLSPTLNLSFLARRLDLESSVIRSYVENFVSCNLDIRF